MMLESITAVGFIVVLLILLTILNDCFRERTASRLREREKDEQITRYRRS